MSKRIRTKARYASLAMLYMTISVSLASYGIYKALPRDKVQEEQPVVTQQATKPVTKQEEIPKLSEGSVDIKTISSTSTADNFEKVDYFSGLIDKWGGMFGGEQSNDSSDNSNSQQQAPETDNNVNKPTNTDTVLDDLSPIDLFFYMVDASNKLSVSHPDELFIPTDEFGSGVTGIINPSRYEKELENLGIFINKDISTLTSPSYYKHHSTNFLSDASQLSKITVNERFNTIKEKIINDNLSSDVYAEYDSNSNIITIVTLTDKYYKDGFNLTKMLNADISANYQIYNEIDFSFNIENMDPTTAELVGLNFKYNTGYNGKVEIILDGTPVVFYDLNYPILPIEIKQQMDELLDDKANNSIHQEDNNHGDDNNHDQYHPTEDDYHDYGDDYEDDHHNYHDYDGDGDSLVDFWEEEEVFDYDDYYNDYSDGLKDEISNVISELENLKNQNNKYKPIWGVQETEAEHLKDNVSEGDDYIDKNFHTGMVLNVIDINGEIVDLEGVTENQKPAEILKPQLLEDPGFTEEEFPVVSMISLSVSVVSLAVFFGYLKQYMEHYTRELEFKLLDTDVEHVEISNMEEITLNEMKTNTRGSDNIDMVLFDNEDK